MKKKLTALQKRQQREKERAERKAYEEGKIKPSPSKKAEKQKAAERREAQKRRSEKRSAQKRTAADVAAMTNANVISDLMQLWNSAYHRYQALKQAGISNVATSVYEQNFAGMNPFANTINENRAMVAALKKWLTRRDISVHRGKKARQKMMQNLDKWGLGDMTESEINDFWDLYDKYTEYIGGMPVNIVQYLEHFSAAYDIYRQRPDMSTTELFDNARDRMMANYEHEIENVFPQSPLGS